MDFYGNHYKFRLVQLLTIYLEGFYGCTISAPFLITDSDSPYNRRTIKYILCTCSSTKTLMSKTWNCSPSLNLHIWEIRREVRLCVSTRVAHDQAKSHMNLQEIIQIHNHFIWSQISNGLWRFRPIASSFSYLLCEFAPRSETSSHPPSPARP